MEYQQTEMDFQLLEAIGADTELLIESLPIDQKYIPLLKSRFAEATHCIPDAPLAAVILCGSILEGVLHGIANEHAGAFFQSSSAPQINGQVKPFDKWSLDNLINVSCKLGFMNDSIKKFSHDLRDFRNYVHLRQQLKEGYTPDADAARICMQIMRSAIRQLSQRHSQIDGKMIRWEHSEYATALAHFNLIGGWNEQYNSDVQMLTTFFGEEYNNWIQKARQILQYSNSPLSLEEGQWMIFERLEIWNSLGRYIYDQDIDKFKSFAISVLTKSSPYAELSIERHLYAGLHGGDATGHSPVLRRGIAEGLAMLGNNSDSLIRCSQHKAKFTASSVIREIFTDADEALWICLDELLPILAEAAPDKFLDCVEQTLHSETCPFARLFDRHDDPGLKISYITGLLWALEGLAWEEEYLIRVCVILAELVAHDPGGSLGNRPDNSLATILYPWFPQTMASIEKRQVAVGTVNDQCPEVGWKLLLRLLPDQSEHSFGSHKPSWRIKIPEDAGENISNEECQQQVLFYAKLAVDIAEHSISKLSDLIDYSHKLPKSAFERVIDILSSLEIAKLSEEQRQLLWERLIDVVSNHGKYMPVVWTMSEEMRIRIQNIAEKMAPSNPFNLHKHLFVVNDFSLYDGNGNYNEQRQRLDKRRQIAVEEIFQQGGIDTVIQFAESVQTPYQVGLALGLLMDKLLEEKILPDLLISENRWHLELVRGFVSERQRINGWAWCDELDKSEWDNVQIGQFLAYLPFSEKTWERVDKLLGDHQKEYWTRTAILPSPQDASLSFAVDKFLEYKKPYEAIICLGILHHAEGSVDLQQCVRALLAELPETTLNQTVEFYIVELIKFLQSKTPISLMNILAIEWRYLLILDSIRNEATPKFLWLRLANNQQFFCDVINWAYPPKEQDAVSESSTTTPKILSDKAFRLLHGWGTPPGMQDDGTFDEAKFTEWFQQVRANFSDSKRLDIVLMHIGKVLTHSPADPGGLWIHRTIAEVLNNYDVQEMRDGYRMELFNSRGAHWVDPTGEPERELAGKYRQMAEEVENARFHRLAITLRKLAEEYDRDAERIIREHPQENNEPGEDEG